MRSQIRRDWEYIAEDNIDAADRVLADIHAVLRTLAASPHIGHRRPDLTARPLRFHVARDEVLRRLCTRREAALGRRDCSRATESSADGCHPSRPLCPARLRTGLMLAPDDANASFYRLVTVCMAVAIAVTGSVSLTRGAQTVRSSTGPGTQVIPPSVEISVMTEGADGRENLELLVLWRGAAGWFLRPGSLTSGSSTAAGHSELTIRRGDLQLTLEYDRPTRVVTIQGKPVRLGADNVVFVDDVDAPGGPRVTGTMRVPRAMPGSAGQIGLVLKESREIMSFLRCDATLPDVPERTWLARLCLQNIGIER